MLASKIEEESRRPRDVINAYDRLKKLYLMKRQGGEVDRKK